MNLVNWKKSRAEHKRLVLHYKKESWKEHTETLNRKTPAAEIFKKINKIKGKYKRNISILYDNHQIFSIVPEIINKIGETFMDIKNAIIIFGII